MLLKLLTKSLFLFCISLAFAETQHEISGGTGAGIQYFKAGTSEFTEIDAFVSYSKRAKFWNWLKWGEFFNLIITLIHLAEAFRTTHFFLHPQ
jgi:hypothetical protein